MSHATITEDMNKLLFGSGTSPEHRINTLHNSIKDYKEKIINALHEISLLSNEKNKHRTITGADLAKFYSEHPGTKFYVSEDRVSLIANNQSVYFHTRRGSDNGDDINNDIIYATLPVYNFRLDFLNSGNVEGEAFAPYGNVGKRPLHPHAQYQQASSSKFATMCQGNNRFISEYYDLVVEGKLDAASFLGLMHRASLWLTTVHLGDTYGNSLAKPNHRPDYPENPEDRKTIIDIMNGQESYEAIPVETDHDEYAVERIKRILTDIHSSYEEYEFEWIKHILWMRVCMGRLGNLIPSPGALEDAIAVDTNIIMGTSSVTLTGLLRRSFYDRSRSDPILCRKKLASFRYMSGRTIREQHPDLFINL